MRPTIHNYSLDGRKALEQILQSSCYGSLVQTVASLTLFSHPKVVAQIKNQNVFRMVRKRNCRGQTDDNDRVVYDDNAGPHMAFVGANNKLKSLIGQKDLQLNHIWPGQTQDVRYYTSLANICVTPSFLAKLTDHSSEIQGLLKFRAYKLYGWHPQELPRPTEPSGYDQLEWASPLDEVENLEKNYRSYMVTRPKNRAVVSVRLYGWCFNNWQSNDSKF